MCIILILILRQFIRTITIVWLNLYLKWTEQIYFAIFIKRFIQKYSALFNDKIKEKIIFPKKKTKNRKPIIWISLNGVWHLSEDVNQPKLCKSHEQSKKKQQQINAFIFHSVASLKWTLLFDVRTKTNVDKVSLTVPAQHGLGISISCEIEMFA